MRTFANKLDAALTNDQKVTTGSRGDTLRSPVSPTARGLTEMARLAGWHPTNKISYAIAYAGENLGTANGANPQDAIANAVADEPDFFRQRAEELRISAEDLIAGLTIRPYEPSDGLDPDGFTSADIGSINSEHTHHTIEQWLNQNNTPYKWIVHFGDAKIQPTPGHITYVKTGNSGGDKLSPHMILHTAGHALVYCNGLELLADDIVTWICKIRGLDLDHPQAETKAIREFCKLLHMNAAKLTLKGHNRGFQDDPLELLNELAGIYIKNGRIKIAPNEHCDYQVDTADIMDIKQHIEASLKAALDKSVDRVIYDN